MQVRVETLTSFITMHQYEISLGLCALFLAYILAVAIKKAKRHFPPGPMGLPIVGYLPFLTKDVHLDFTELGKKYGDVFSVRLGSRDVVILHGREAITEALTKQAFIGRPPTIGANKLRSSVIFSNNFLLWKEQHKFMVKSMKDLGLGKTKIEKAIIDEINHFMKVLRSHQNQPIYVKESLSPSISNSMCSLVFGKRFEYDDPEILFLTRNIDETFELVAQTPLDLSFPWIRYIPFASKLLEVHKARTLLEESEKYFKKKLNERMETTDPAHAQDFIDLYLEEIDTQRAKNPDTFFNHNMLVNSAMDLFIAGSESVRTSIIWFIYIFAAFPHVQKKVQKEIIEVIGSEKTVEYMDMRNMPYTYAVLLEMMRWKTVIPLSLVHYTMSDTTVGGYHVPKDTLVFPNLWAVHHDPRYWDEPEKFIPERFLSKDGKSVVKPDYFMPFSVGRRACPGASMAYLEMFLYLTSILREFDIAFPDGTYPTFDAKFMFVYRLEPYLVRFIPKN